MAQERIKSFCIAKPMQKLCWTERRLRRERLWKFQARARGSKLGIGLETGRRRPRGARVIVAGGACLCREPPECRPIGQHRTRAGASVGRCATRTCAGDSGRDGDG